MSLSLGIVLSCFTFPVIISKRSYHIVEVDEPQSTNNHNMFHQAQVRLSPLSDEVDTSLTDLYDSELPDLDLSDESGLDLSDESDESGLDLSDESGLDLPEGLDLPKASDTYKLSPGDVIDLSKGSKGSKGSRGTKCKYKCRGWPYQQCKVGPGPPPQY